jgi:hypothetical protein
MKFMSVKMMKQHIFIIENNLQKVGQSFFHLSRRTTRFPLKYTIANYYGEPRDIPNIYLIRIFSVIWLNNNWH